jgi:hypothetical protein
MSEIILKENTTKFTYVVCLPGMQIEIESPLELEAYVAHINNMINKNHVIKLDVEDGNKITYYVSPHQHFPVIVMTKRCFLAKASRQQFMQGH